MNTKKKKRWIPRGEYNDALARLALWHKHDRELLKLIDDQRAIDNYLEKRRKL